MPAKIAGAAMVKGWIVDFFRRSIGLHYRCSRCGRELHDRKSIARGMGPECWKINQDEIVCKELYGEERNGRPLCAKDLLHEIKEEE